MSANQTTDSVASVTIPRANSKPRSEGDVGSGSGRLAAHVVIPTTGGAILVRGLKPRPLLPTNWVTLEDDFRHLAMSESYADLVRGPLAGHVEHKTYQLVVSGDIDTGRSWELPVLIAHLLEARGCLSNGTFNTSPPPPEAGERLIFATGKLDSELAPLADRYHLRLKIAQAKELLDDAAKKNLEVVFILPADLDDDDRQAIAEAAEPLGARVLPCRSFQDVRDAVERICGEELPAGGMWFPNASRLHVLAVFLGAAVLAALFAGGSYLSGGSILSAKDAFSSLLVQRVEAETMEACHMSLYEGTGQITRLAVRHGEAGYTMPLSSGFCGLRIVNIGGRETQVALDAALMGDVIVGDWSLMGSEGQRLAPGWETVVYFTRPPPPGRYDLRLTGKQAHTTHIEFTAASRSDRGAGGKP